MFNRQQLINDMSINSGDVKTHSIIDSLNSEPFNDINSITFIVGTSGKGKTRKALSLYDLPIMYYSFDGIGVDIDLNVDYQKFDLSKIKYDEHMMVNPIKFSKNLLSELYNIISSNSNKHIIVDDIPVHDNTIRIIMYKINDLYNICASKNCKLTFVFRQKINFKEVVNV